MDSFCGHVYACIYQSQQNICLPRDYYFLGWFLFVGMYLSVTQDICLPRDYYFFGCFLFVGMYVSVTTKCLPRGYYFLDDFFLWACFCHSSHDSPKRMSVLFSFQVLHFCPGTTFIVMVSFCVHVFVNHSNICKYICQFVTSV